MWKKRYIPLLALLVFVGVTVSEAQSIPFEPVAWNADRLETETGNIMTFTEKMTNFMDASGTWKDANLSPTVKNGKFVVDEAPYTVEMPLMSNDTITFSLTNRYDFATKSFKDDPPVNKSRRFTVNSVLGEATEEGIVYPGAFSFGDLVLQPDNHEMRYLVKFNKRPAICNTQSTIEIPFTQTFDGNVPRKGDNSVIKSTDETIRGYSVGLTEHRKIYTPRAKIWDMLGRTQLIDIVGKFSNGTFTAKKVIPCSFFTASRVYPVYTDDVDVFNPDASPETTSVDGWVDASNAVWATGQGAASGAGANDNGAVMYSYVGKDAGGIFQFGRLFAHFDTSALIDTYTVTATTLQFRVNADATFTAANDSDGKDYWTVHESLALSNTAIIAADYDQCGDAIDNPTKLSNDVFFSAITSNAFNTWTINAAGLLKVSKTDVTRFCLREGHDQTDDAYAGANNTYNSLAIASADSANDPILTVTSSLPTSPSAPKRPNKGWDQWSFLPKVYAGF